MPRLHLVCRWTTIIALILTLSAIARPQSIPDSRKSTALQIKKDLSSLGIRKVYVPDFCGSSPASGSGAFFASFFSVLLADAKNFAVLSRVVAHRFLLQNHWTDCDLSDPGILKKFSSEFAIDSILAGSFVPKNDSFSMNFVLFDLSGKELYFMDYNEPFQAGNVGLFPAVSAASGWPFFLPGYERVSL